MSPSQDRIQLRDKNGVTRICLGVGHDGAPYFSMHDKKGLDRIIAAGTNAGATNLGLHDASGQGRAGLGYARRDQNYRDGPGIGFMDFQSNSLFSHLMVSLVETKLEFYSANQKRTARCEIETKQIEIEKEQ